MFVLVRVLILSESWLFRRRRLFRFCLSPSREFTMGLVIACVKQIPIYILYRCVLLCIPVKKRFRPGFQNDPVNQRIFLFWSTIEPWWWLTKHSFFLSPHLRQPFSLRFWWSCSHYQISSYISQWLGNCSGWKNKKGNERLPNRKGNTTQKSFYFFSLPALPRARPLTTFNQFNRNLY
jgi:hypothetical protein